MSDYMDISDDGYYGSGSEDNDGSDDDLEHGDVDEDTPVPSTEDYSVLKENDIMKLQKDEIKQLSGVFSITELEASILLRHFNWNVTKIHDEWFADENKVRATVGILESPVVSPSHYKKVTCGICFDSYPSKEMASVSCGHLFCTTCWTGYIKTAINDGPGCLMIRCPEPPCRAAVGHDMVDKLMSEEDQKKYHRYFLRSYIECYKKMKWCPAPACEYAVHFDAGSGSNFDVSCKCSYEFCWKCIEEAHRPVDCDTVSKWILKNTSEAENTTWILANSKPCPKCKNPIEKNHGCMHMTCRPPCSYEFCWLCLGDWKEHGSGTGGNYGCNRYQSAKMKGEYNEEEVKREMAKHIIEKYTHYYERWSGNHKSRQKAIEALKKAETKDLEKLSDRYATPESQLSFILKAWLQIIECRRVLKWTYAYGYYLPETEYFKLNFFEYLQGEAEHWLERLHKCLEKDLAVFFDDNSSSKDDDSSSKDDTGSSQDFKNFQTTLTGLTSVTKTYFENLVRALENGLADVDSHAASINNPINSESTTGSSQTNGLVGTFLHDSFRFR